MFVYDKKTEKKYEVIKIKKENNCTRFFIRKDGQWLWEDADCFVTWEETEVYKLSLRPSSLFINFIKEDEQIW